MMMKKTQKVCSLILGVLLVMLISSTVYAEVEQPAKGVIDITPQYSVYASKATVETRHKAVI